MAGTTKTNRNTTLEDITRRCSVGIGTRTTIIEEAIVIAGQAVSHASEAEQLVTGALSAIAAAKPAFVGNSEYMLTSTRLLGELIAELERDLQEIRAAQVAISNYEGLSAEILDQLITYSVDAIQARIKARMNRLGGDFSVPSLPRPSLTPNPASLSMRRRSEQPPTKELVIADFEERVPVEALVDTGLDSFERGSELLESCFQDLEGAQQQIGTVVRHLSAMNDKFREVERLEIGSNSQKITDAIESVRKIIKDAENQSDRLTYVAGASDRVRSPLLAIMENMGNLLLSGVLSEMSPAESREVTARDVLQKALKGDRSELGNFTAVAGEAQREALTEALFHATRTRELDEASHAVEALKHIALLGGGARTEASDKLLSLSNSLSVSEAIRAAATAALIDLTANSDSTE